MSLNQRILLITALLLFQLPALLAQESPRCTLSIEGKIYDLQTEEPLLFANVLLEGEGKGAATDAEGYFRIEGLCAKEYDLVVSYVGYKTMKHHHDFHHDFVKIFLAPAGMRLKGVVVEAQRSQVDMQTVSTSRLSEEELQAVASESLGDAVEQIAGVSTLRTGQNIVKPVIHGLHSNRVLTINNGLRHEFQNWGSEHAPEIDPSLVDELEVIKGAATVRYGPEALGGVILIRPPRMELSTPLGGELGLTGKSNGHSGEGKLELQKGFKRFSLLGGGAYVKQGDLQAPDYNLTNTGKEELSYYGGLRFHPASWLDIEGYYSRFDQTLGILSGSVFGNLDDLQRAIESEVPLFTEPFSYDIDQPKQEVRHDLYKGALRITGDKQSLTLQYGYQFNHRQEFGVRRSDAPNIDLELVTQSLEAHWRHPDWGPLSGKLGFQGQKQANDNLPGTQTVPFIPNYDSWEYGIYLIESLDLGESTLELGLRFDQMEADITGREPDNTIYRNTINYRNVTGTLGLTTPLGEYSSFRTNFGTAWRPPNVAELYRFGQHAFFLEYGLWRYTIDDRFDFISTSEGILDQNDRAVPSEVGYKWINTYSINRQDFRAEMTGYVNYIENYIFTRPGGLTRTPRGFFVFFLYDQTNALFWGADLSAEWQHHPQFTSQLKGSYLWSQQLNPKDYFVGQPPPQLNYQLSFQPEMKGLEQSTFQLRSTYTFEQFQHPRILGVEEFLFAGQNGIDRFSENASDFDILPPPSGYFLLDFSWRGSFRQFGWQFQVRNLLNQSYRNYTDRLRYFADDIGRNFVLSLNFKI